MVPILAVLAIWAIIVVRAMAVSRVPPLRPLLLHEMLSAGAGLMALAWVAPLVLLAALAIDPASRPLAGDLCLAYAVVAAMVHAWGALRPEPGEIGPAEPPASKSAHPGGEASLLSSGVLGATRLGAELHLAQEKHWGEAVLGHVPERLADAIRAAFQAERAKAEEMAQRNLALLGIAEQAEAQARKFQAEIESNGRALAALAAENETLRARARTGDAEAVPLARMGRTQLQAARASRARDIRQIDELLGKLPKAETLPLPLG